MDKIEKFITKKIKIMVDRYTTIVYYITRVKHKRAHKLIHAIVA